MNKGPIIILFFILAIFLILYVSLNQELGYEKIDTLGKYTILVRHETNNYQEMIYIDQKNEYFIQKQYILKSQFRTLSLKEALLNEIITINEALSLFPEITLKPIAYIEVGIINNNIIYQSENLQPKCKQNLEYFYLDNLYEYYFNCELSKYYLIRNNLNDFTLTEALEEKLLSIDDLQKLIPSIKYKSITYQVIKKNSNNEIVETAFKYETKEKLEIIYLFDNKIYYFLSPQSKFYKVKVDNEYLTLQDALALNILTIEEVKIFIPEIYER